MWLLQLWNQTLNPKLLVNVVSCEGSDSERWHLLMVPLLSGRGTNALGIFYNLLIHSAVFPLHVSSDLPVSRLLNYRPETGFQHTKAFPCSLTHGVLHKGFPMQGFTQTFTRKIWQGRVFYEDFYIQYFQHQASSCRVSYTGFHAWTFLCRASQKPSHTDSDMQAFTRGVAYTDFHLLASHTGFHI